MKKTIIIIGAGAAGLSAALEATENNFNVKLVSSMASERSQSVMAEGGINGAVNTKDEDDSPEQHYEDTIKAGCGLADPNAVWNMTQAAPELIRWLYSIGVQFNTDEHNELDLRNFGGQKKKRTAFSKSESGKQIVTALIDAVRKKEAEGLVERFDHHNFVTLDLKNNKCCGCVIMDRYSGKTISLVGNGVIIATGGMHGLFGDTTGSLANTGMVTAELFKQGVVMADLEMIQFHPTTVEIGGKRMLISEAARGEGGRLFADREGKRWYFMEEKYPELGNLMPRDITSREIRKVSAEYTVYLDMTELSEEVISKKLSGLADDCLTYIHKDIRKEPIAVLPGIHYFMGGIFVDESHRTNIKNLYASGECCCQYHGANRLGGNSLLGAVYGGKTAAKTACSDGSEEEVFSVEKAEDTEQVESVNDVKRLNEIMLKTMDVVRDEASLKEGLEQLKKIKGDLSLLGQAMIESALARKESRGAHWREDHPMENNEKFLKTTLATYSNGKIKISFGNIPKRRCIK